MDFGRQCCGGFPCTRCQNRGFECEYDGNPSVRGKRRVNSAEPGPQPAGSSTSGFRTSPKSTRGEHKYQPYPPSTTRTSSPTVKSDSADRSPSNLEAKSPATTAAGSSTKAPSIADSLGLKHLQAALEVAIEMDRASCMQNSSFVTDAVKPLEPGMEMSTMVETVAVLRPCVEQGDAGLCCDNAGSQAPSEEDLQDTLKVPSVSKGGPLP